MLKNIFIEFFTLPNALSFFRIPLALLFLQSNPLIRACAILLALLSDGLDGYLARKNRQVSSLGSLIDPLMDKFFVIFTLSILYSEHPLPLWQVCAMLCRDFSIILFGFFLFLTNNLSKWRLRSIWCGKITTVLQLCVLFAFTFQLEVPSFIFVSFVIFGVLALAELYFARLSELSYE